MTDSKKLLVDDLIITLEKIIDSPDDLETQWKIGRKAGLAEALAYVKEARANTTALTASVKDEGYPTCDRCMGTGYENHIDSGYVCSICNGKGSYHETVKDDGLKNKLRHILMNGFEYRNDEAWADAIIALFQTASGGEGGEWKHDGANYYFDPESKLIDALAMFQPNAYRKEIYEGAFVLVPIEIANKITEALVVGRQ